jgi:site-specific recombinase XerD
LNNVIARELQNCGAAVTIGEKHSATHLLRHACANRWWAMGISLIDIAWRLGHQSVHTTVTTYLHIAPFLQREFMLGFSNEPVTFTTLVHLG